MKNLITFSITSYIDLRKYTHIYLRCGKSFLNMTNRKIQKINSVECSAYPSIIESIVGGSSSVLLNLWM